MFNAMSVSYIMSGEYTIMSHATLFTNLSGFMIVFYRLFCNKTVHIYEMIGSAVAISGCVLTIFDTSANKVNLFHSNVLMGDGIGLLGSIASALYFNINGSLFRKMPSLLAVTINIFGSSIILLIYGCYLFDNFTLSTNAQTGAFGYINSDMFLYVILVLGVGTGVCTFVGYSLVLNYFSPLVLCTAFLFEPAIAQIFGCLMGLDQIPGLFTLLGGTISICGLFFISYGGLK